MNGRVKNSDLGKPWNKRNGRSKAYKMNGQLISKSFLIVCEGKNTEPKYFGSFPVVSASVKTEGGLGSRTALVRATIKLMKLEENKGRETWCVFDYDHKPDNLTIPGDYNNAIHLAKNSGIKVAYSNDCFELWFILHYKYHQAASIRTDYFDTLRDIWGLEHSYEELGKEADFCDNLYELLLPHQHIAIANAKKLLEQVDDQIFSTQNPVTTVFELVEELNNYLRK